MTTPLPAPYYVPGDSVDNVLYKTRNLCHTDAAVALPDSQKPNESPVVRHPLATDSFKTTFHPDVQVVYDVLKYALQRNPHHKLLAYKDSPLDKAYKFVTTQEVADLSVRIGSGLLHVLHSQASISTSKDTVATFYLANCYQFPIIDFATQAYGLTNTCIYDTLGADSFSFIFGLTKSPVVFTTKSKVTLIAALRIEHLKIIVTIDDLSLAEDHALFAETNAAGILLYDLKSLVAIGAKNLKEPAPATPDDIMSISFTSGTTSHPKGAVITQRMAVAQTIFFPANVGVPSAGSSYCFLPLAHVYARAATISDILAGLTIYFPSDPGNTPSYFKDIIAIRPACFLAVPRVLTRIEAVLKAKLQSSSFIKNTIAWKIRQLEQGKDPHHFVYDTFFAGKLRAAFGLDRAAFIGCGSAALAVESVHFLWAALNLPVKSGVGFTEAGGGVSASSDSVAAIGTNGIPFTAAEYKLADVPDMGYTWEKNRSGELLVRGPGITSTYYKQHHLFQESLTSDGWYRTGDIGKFDDNYRLFMLDRIKNFFKLSQGKFIASEKIQNLYTSNSHLVDQIFIHGTSVNSFIVGIVGLNLAFLKQFFTQHSISFAFDWDTAAVDYTKVDVQPLLKFINSDSSLRKQLVVAINASVASGLQSYELIKNAYFDVEPFSIEKDTMTPTMKIKRFQVRQKFASEIEAMFKEGIIVPSSGKL